MTPSPIPTPGAGSRLRSDLLTSWQRSQEALGSPEFVRDVPQVQEDRLDVHLLELLQAPLARVADQLDGTGLGLLLADAEGRILQRWAPDSSAAHLLDRWGTVRGAVLTEAIVGTNGVGTVAATGRSIQITGEEHFASFYRSAVCTGSPVLHPATGRLLGVVTLSSKLTERADLLRPLVHSIAGQIGQHVLDSERPAARRVLAEFLRATRTHAGPVFALGPDGFVVQSRAAADLAPEDLALLRSLCSGRDRSAAHTVEFSTGAADVHVRPLEDGTGAVAVVRTVPTPAGRAPGPAAAPLAGRSPQWLGTAALVARHRESRTPLIVAGEAGTGKTSLALGAPHRRDGVRRAAAVLDAAESHVHGPRRFLQRLADRLETGSPVVVRGVETLDTGALAGLKSLVDPAVGRTSVLLTTTAPARADAVALGARLGYPVACVPALRDRPGDLPLLWRALADDSGPAAHLTLAPDALTTLEHHGWAGNTAELRNLVEQLLLTGRRGQVTSTDLPDTVRDSRPLTMIERVELEAIQRALREAGGNRSRAAEILGLSRATIYRKMKAYRLTA